MDKILDDWPTKKAGQSALIFLIKWKIFHPTQYYSATPNPPAYFIFFLIL